VFSWISCGESGDCWWSLDCGICLMGRNALQSLDKEISDGFNMVDDVTLVAEPFNGLE